MCVCVCVSTLLVLRICGYITVVVLIEIVYYMLEIMARISDVSICVFIQLAVDSRDLCLRCATK
jgi:hypothetical protein